MNWTTWKTFYDAILADFGYDREADAAARELLRDLSGERLGEMDADSLRAWSRARDAFRETMQRGEVWILGPALTPETLARVPRDAVVIVTDGAAHLALPTLQPAAIVTDLDGDVPAQIAASARGATLFVHAHGDNVEALQKWVPQIPGVMFGTTQTGPLPPTWNHGGFTDGDRACCIAVAFGAPALVLAGFDFETPVAKNGQDPSVKKRKLAWAKRIIEALPVPVRYV